MSVTDLIPLWLAFSREMAPWLERGAPTPAPPALVDAALAYCDVETAMMLEDPSREDVPDQRYPSMVSAVNEDPQMREAILFFCTGWIDADSEEGRRILQPLVGGAA